MAPGQNEAIDSYRVMRVMHVMACLGAQGAEFSLFPYRATRGSTFQSDLPGQIYLGETLVENILPVGQVFELRLHV